MRKVGTARRDGGGKVDIRDVARLARVSVATVSRTINRVPTVDETLAARVWAAVKELNYTPDPQARALPSGKSRLLGLIVSEITNPFFPELIQEFERVAVERGYEILIGSTSYDAATMERCVRRMLERKVEGVAVMTFGIEQTMLDRFADVRVPVVYMDKAPAMPGASAITVDYRAGIFEGVQHLAVLGHRRIGFISGPAGLWSAQERRRAFAEGLEEIGLTPEPRWVVEGNHTLEGGRDAMRRLLAEERLPTALLCSNDVTAIGVQHALFEAGLRVPEDLSLIGFDDVHLAEYTIPPLTTVRMGCAELAEAAVRRLLRRPDVGAVEVEEPVQTRLVVRRTTGLPKDSLADLRGGGATWQRGRTAEGETARRRMAGAGTNTTARRGTMGGKMSGQTGEGESGR